jgi:hypothetical protein
MLMVAMVARILRLWTEVGGSEPVKLGLSTTQPGGWICISAMPRPSAVGIMGS